MTTMTWRPHLGDWRVGWRQLLADPGYSLAVLLGLALAIGCGLLVAQVVFNAVLPDPDVPDPGRVVTLEFRGNVPGEKSDWFDQAPFVFGTTLRQAGAPVSAIARDMVGLDLVAHAGDRAVRLGVEFADADIVAIFGLRPSAGDVRAALARPDAIALTAASARRLFPAGDALGQTVLVHGRSVTIVAILAPRARTDDDGEHDALMSFDSPLCPVDEDTRTAWYSMQGKVFARVARGATADEVGAAAQALFDDGPGARSVPPEWTAHGRKGAFLRATPLTRQYLAGGRYGHANTMQLLALAGGAALMLALALVNYVNLTSVRTLARAREIAVRKTLGAGPWRLTAQFVAESTLVAALAAAIGLLLAWWIAPTISALLSLPLIDGLFAPTRLALLLVGALVLGVCTGLYPARIALTVNCLVALAGRSHDESAVGRGLRRAMTALQFVVALVIAAGACTMLWQNHYVASLARGIRTQGLLAVDPPDGYTGRSDAVNMAFREALSHEPGVQAMAWSMDVPGRGEASSTISVARSGAGIALTVDAVPVDRDFFDVYDIRPLAGAPRVPPPDSEPAPPTAAASASAAPRPEQLVVLDASASRALGFATPADAIDQTLLGGGDHLKVGHDPLRIVAVVPDIRLEDAHATPQPHVFALGRRPQGTLTLRGTDVGALRQAVDRVWPRFFPEDMPEIETVADAVEHPYRREHRFAQMATATTGLALLLSAFGVYALAAYTVRRSAREIVVRKLYGAGRARIAAVLAREFAPLLAVAAFVGLPLAGWLAQAWLANFVERSGAVFWSLPLALLALVATTAIAALRHALVAMRMRPAQALRG